MAEKGEQTSNHNAHASDTSNNTDGKIGVINYKVSQFKMLIIEDSP